MSREVHVRFCEGLGLQCPGLLTRASLCATSFSTGRSHTALDGRTPDMVYFGARPPGEAA